MRVFVTGASGFIGRRLLPRLCADGHRVTALLLPAEPPLRVDGVGIARGDITRADTLHGVLDGHDAVVHLAGAVGYGQTFERCNAINRDGTAHVAAEAARVGARRFVHMSSVSVYGRVANVRITEDFPLRKIGDPYGDTKIDAEHIVGALAARGALDLTIVRPTVIYGPGDDKFLPRLADNLRSGRARIVGSGRNTVDLIHVDDAVDFLARGLTDRRAVGGVYNLTHPANPTWNEFVALVAETLGVPPPRRHLPYPVALVVAGLMQAWAAVRGGEPRLSPYMVRVIGRQYHYVTERAERELGFMPRIRLRDGIRDCLAASPA
jgi:nucleoside-diphosphate-sugar epimerase